MAEKSRDYLAEMPLRVSRVLPKAFLGKNPSLSADVLCLYLKEQTHGTHYYGSSEYPESRLKQHNSGKVRYTKGRRPWELIYTESFETRSEAVHRERFFKSIEGYQWLKNQGII